MPVVGSLFSGACLEDHNEERTVEGGGQGYSVSQGKAESCPHTAVRAAFGDWALVLSFLLATCVTRSKSRYVFFLGSDLFFKKMSSWPILSKVSVSSELIISPSFFPACFLMRVGSDLLLSNRGHCVKIDTQFSSTENYERSCLYTCLNLYSTLDQCSSSESTLDRWGHGVLLLVNKILQTVIYICDSSWSSPLLKPAFPFDFHLVTQAGHWTLPRPVHHYTLLPLLMEYFLLSNLIASALVLDLTSPSCGLPLWSCPTSSYCHSFWQSHLGCKLIVSPAIACIHCRLGLPKAWLWLHHFCVKNYPWILDASGAKTRIPSLSIKVLCGWLSTTCLGLFFINSH